MQKCASPFVEVRQIEFLARETPNYIATNLHISHQWTCESVSGSHLGSEATRRTRSVAMIHRMTETEPQGSVNTTCLVREPTSAFSVRWGGSYCPLCSTPRNRGRSAPRKHHHTFLESRYRSSDVGRARLQTGEAHLFISAPSGGYSSLYFASQSRSASTAFVRTKCGTHVLDGDTPYPVIRTKDSAYNGVSGGFPSPRKSSTDATDHDALQPLRGSEADCVRSPIRQSIPSRPQHRSKRRAHRARRDGAEPHFR